MRNHDAFTPWNKSVCDAGTDIEFQKFFSA